MGHKAPLPRRQGKLKAQSSPEESSSSSSDEEEVMLAGGGGDDASGLALPPAEAAQLQSLLLFEQTDIAPVLLREGFDEYRALLLEREALYATHVAAKRDALVRQSMKRKRSGAAVSPTSSGGFFTMLAHKVYRRVQQGLLTPIAEEMAAAWGDHEHLASMLDSFVLFDFSVEDDQLLAAVSNVTRRYLWAGHDVGKTLRPQAIDGVEFTLHFSPQEFHSSSSASLQFFFAGSSFHRLGQLRFGRVVDVRSSRLAWLPNAKEFPANSFFGTFFSRSADLQLPEAVAEGDTSRTFVGSVLQSVRQVLHHTLYDPALVPEGDQVPRCDVMVWGGVCEDKGSATRSAGPLSVSSSTPSLRRLLDSISGDAASTSSAITTAAVLLNAALMPVVTHLLYALSSVETIDLDEADDEDGEDEDEFEEEEDDDEDDDGEDAVVPPPTVKPPPRKPAQTNPKQPPGRSESLKKPECKQQ